MPKLRRAALTPYAKRILPHEAHQLYAFMQLLTNDPRSRAVMAEQGSVESADHLLNEICTRHTTLPDELPNDIIIARLPRPRERNFDDHMRSLYFLNAPSGDPTQKIRYLPYTDYSCKPYPHVRAFTSTQDHPFVAIMQNDEAYYDSAYGHGGNKFHFRFVTDFIFPVDLTIDLCDYDVLYGPYAGQNLIDHFNKMCSVVCARKKVRYMYRTPTRLAKVQYLAHLTTPFAELNERPQRG